MSQEEIRKLIGGYATGTLTEAERKALFAAALDDQDLFDEMAREQSLKELLDSPGARTRLTAALAPPEPALPANRFRRAIGGMLAAGFAIALGLVLVVVRNPRPQDLAAVAKPESRELKELFKVTPEPPHAAPTSTSALRLPRAINQPVPARTQGVNNTVTPLPPPVLLQPPPENALKKAESARRDEPVQLDTIGPAVADKQAADQQAAEKSAAAEKSVKDEKDVAPPRPQPPAQAVQVQATPSAVGHLQQQNAEGVTVAAAPLAVTTNSPGTTAPALRGARSATAARKAGATRFAFDYSIRHDSLTVNPLAAGFLQVTAATPGGQQIVLQAPSRQEAGTSVTFPVPAGSLTLTIEFSSRPAVQNLAASLESLQNSRFRQKAASPAVAPAISNEKTGHVEAPTATANPGLSITVPVPAE
jgi:hypothetical protein